MVSITHFVALPFMRSAEDDGGAAIVAGEPKEARGAEHALLMAGAMARAEGHCGAIAFLRTGDPATGNFEDAVVLATFGEVDEGLLAS